MEPMNQTIGAPAPTPTALNDLSQILSDIHGSLSTLENRLNLVSIRSEQQNSSTASTPSAVPAHVSELLDSSVGIRNRLDKILSELVI
jgi:hypothetical protein